MVVLNKKDIRLPRVEREKFIALLRLGLDYHRELGTFSISNCNQIERLATALAEILNAEEVGFSQSCVLCGANFPCNNCKYLEKCTTKNLPFECVCSKCLEVGPPEEHL